MILRGENLKILRHRAHICSAVRLLNGEPKSLTTMMMMREEISFGEWMIDVAREWISQRIMF